MMYPIYDLRGNSTWTEIDGVTTKIVSTPPLGNWRGTAGSLKVEYTGECQNKPFEIDGRPGTLYTVNAEISSAFGVKHTTLYEFLPDDLVALSIEDAAEVAQTSVQAVRDAIKRGQFPNAYRTSDHPQRGEWRIPRAEVEAWKPRRVKP